MASVGYINGCPVEFSDGAWRWRDTGRAVREDRRSHECPHCGKLPGPNGEDGCLGMLPGVTTACCGHGRRDGYIIFDNGVRLDFQLTEPPTFATPTRPQPPKTWVVTEDGQEL